MMNVAYALAGLTSCLFLLSLLFLVWWMWDQLYGDEDFQTSPEATLIIASQIMLHGYERGTLYDLGCCRGYFAKNIGKLLPYLKIVGVDNSRFRIIAARIRTLFAKNRPRFIYGDLSSLQYENANLFNVYLPQELLEPLEQRLLAFKSRVIFTYRVSFRNMRPTTTIPLQRSSDPRDKVFVYHT